MRGSGTQAAGHLRLLAAVSAALVLVTTLLMLLPAAPPAGAASGTAGGSAAGGGQAPTTAADPGQRPAGRTVVSLTFDDGDADQLGAARTLHAHGLAGTFYIITGAVGTPGYLTLDGLRQLKAGGMEIGGHTVSHLDLARVSAAEARRQICASRDVLARWGMRATSFAYPGAVSNRALEKAVADCGFTSARVAAGLRSPGCPDCKVAESVPPANPYAIRGPGQLDGRWTLASLQEQVRRVQQQGGGWLPLIFHHICTGSQCGPLAVRAQVLERFAAWLAQQRGSGIEVRTVGEVTGGKPRPLVTPPPAAPHGVVNSSLESESRSASVDPSLELPGVPGMFLSCWMPGGYGSRDVHWARTRDAHTGRWALTATVSRYRSGDVKLMQQFDLGRCSLPVSPGHSYQLSSDYRSTVRTQYSVFYRNADGRWAYWTSSPYFPASGNWARASWRTPPLPADATGLSFGLAIAGNGSITTDSYRFGPAAPDSAGTAIHWVLIAEGAAAAVAVGWGVTRVLRRRRRSGPPAAGDQATLPGPRTSSSSRR